MITALELVIAILLAFTALGLACAVAIGWRRPPPADPFSVPFGEMPGFSDAQLRALSRRSVERACRDPLRRSFASRPIGDPGESETISADATRRRAGGGLSFFPSGLAAVRSFMARLRHA